ncbi:unnamed protein product [Callosobruchus maculatus]|uniref:DUF4780 domain-containing protein n=1 Tax=Callosobruchus maculatus TaxID=64391 RepID=A0A653BIF5_CALMS|nr:unnamed protein product [Callosobruchus maculatus]
MTLLMALMIYNRAVGLSGVDVDGGRGRLGGGKTALPGDDALKRPHAQNVQLDNSSAASRSFHAHLFIVALKSNEMVIISVQGMGLQMRPRLSGAQRRKLVKERKMAEGTWTEKNPRKKAPGHKKGERRPPAKPSGAVKDLNKAGPKGKGRVGDKRPRDDSKTPPQTSKKPRQDKGPSLTYSEVASNRMAVVHRLHPDIILEKGQADLISERLLKVLDEDSSTSPIQFINSTYSGGALWITCANEATGVWLRGTVASMGSLWEGADLTVVESKDLPKRPRVLVFVPEKDLEKQKEGPILARLGKQNPDLRVACWHLLSKKEQAGKGVTLSFSIDENVTSNCRFLGRAGQLIFLRPRPHLNRVPPSNRAGSTALYAIRCQSLETKEGGGVELTVGGDRLTVLPRLSCGPMEECLRIGRPPPPPLAGVPPGELAQEGAMRILGVISVLSLRRLLGNALATRRRFESGEEGLPPPPPNHHPPSMPPTKKTLSQVQKKLKAVTVWRTVLNQLKSRVSKQSGVSSQTDMAMKELIKRFERLDDIAILCSAKA